MRMPKFKKPNLKSILLYYSIFLSTILIIGGFYTARSIREIISNLLFLPIVIFLWLMLIKHRKEGKKLKDQSKLKNDEFKDAENKLNFIQKGKKL